MNPADLAALQEWVRSDGLTEADADEIKAELAARLKEKWLGKPVTKASIREIAHEITDDAFELLIEKYKARLL